MVEEQIEKFVGFVKSEKSENALVEEIKIESIRGQRYRDVSEIASTQLSYPKSCKLGLNMLEKQDSMLETGCYAGEAGRKTEETRRNARR
ncbi:MAG: hypothetical protein DRO98_04930 [Archaeoglobales archaeon]|nr:MAG: hypothetical protein DRO98_04930 [Archaeoglobales archaeon]